MSDRIVALLRTAVPALWGTLLAWLVARGLPADLAAAALGDLGEVLLLPLAVAAYYAAARWLEARPWMPDWLVRALLGSAKTPSYWHTITGDGTSTPLPPYDPANPVERNWPPDLPGGAPHGRS